MNTSVIRVIVLLSIAGLVGLSCQETPAENHAPTITALELPASVNAGTDATFSCAASDPDGDALSYNWTCSSGSLQSTTGSAVNWTSPETSGTATIAVVVRDGSGASDSSSGTVTVDPVVATLIDWDGVVQAYGVQPWHINVPAGYTLSGSFSADGQDITFLVLDQANYQKWGFPDSTYDGLVVVDSSAGSSFSAVVPATGLYHFILDNQYNATADTAVHLFVQSTSP
jgi:hypothetical protein